MRDSGLTDRERRRKQDPESTAPRREPDPLWLAHAVGNHAMTAFVQRRRRLARDNGATATKAETVTVTVSWNKSAPPRAYLKKVFDEHPVDWSADVYVGKKKVGSGVGSLDVELVKGKQVAIRVVPTAAAPDDYFREKTKKKVQITGDAIDIRLPFRRENDRYARQSWIENELDPDKVVSVQSVELLGHRIEVNELVVPRVEATNQYFLGPDLTPEERLEVKASIVRMGGYNTRTTSEGGYSNHSTGCAVDINENMSTKQAHHWKKKNTGDKQLMELFARVVRLDPALASYDPWKTEKREAIVAASDAFNARFPAYLAGLLDDALGGNTYSVLTGSVLAMFIDEGRMLTSMVDPALLDRAIAAAEKAAKPGTKKSLEAVKADWGHIRAWIEGIVVYKKKGDDDKDWAYASEHEAAVAGGTEKRAVKGRLQGMLPLHPKLIETMEATGWEWLVHSQHAKDLMHFQDSEAEAKLKKT